MTHDATAGLPAYDPAQALKTTLAELAAGAFTFPSVEWPGSGLADKLAEASIAAARKAARVSGEFATDLGLDPLTRAQLADHLATAVRLAVSSTYVQDRSGNVCLDDWGQAIHDTQRAIAAAAAEPGPIRLKVSLEAKQAAAVWEWLGHSRRRADGHPVDAVGQQPRGVREALDQLLAAWWTVCGYKVAPPPLLNWPEDRKK